MLSPPELLEGAGEFPLPVDPAVVRVVVGGIMCFGGSSSVWLFVFSAF